jgi:cytochrome P450
MDTEPLTAGPITDDWCLHHFDHLSTELPEKLPDTLARMRTMCPVARSDEHGGFWVVTAYEDVLRVAQDWATFSSAQGLTVPVAPIAVRNIPVEVDPPLHRVYKRLINAYFTPAAVAPWEPAARALVNRLVDDFIESGRCEFMEAFARALPALSFFESAIGAPRDEIDKVAYMASKSSAPNDPEAAEAWLGLSNWISDFLETRRKQPRRGDVVDGVLEAEIEGRPITHEEVVGTIQLLILGGLETTAGALGMMMVRLCNDPTIPDLLRRRPDLLSEAVEELLRLDAPFIAIARTATRDTELGGRQIKEGDKVVIYWTSANRDEAEFPEPDRFSLERGSNRHVSFGVGPHRCAGSNLARMNLRVSLAELLRRLDDLKLEPGAEIHYHSTFTRAPLAVPITFAPGLKAGTEVTQSS